MSTPKPICRLTEVKDTAELMGSFLSASDLANLCQASKGTKILFSNRLPEMALLKAVFDADPKRVKEILGEPKLAKTKCIILTKTHLKETYFSQSTGKIGCKRVWENVSPLEAAAWCGDIFLVKELILHLPENKRQEAASQLRGILQHEIFLAPYRELINAYNIFNEMVNKTYKKHEEDPIPGYLQRYGYSLLDRYWNEVWLKQRNLPTYGLQELFFDKKGFGRVFIDKKPILFDEEPKRACIYKDGSPLDLDSMRYGFALFQPTFEGAETWGAFSIGRNGNRRDLGLTKRLCEKRTEDLRNLIEELECAVVLGESLIDCEVERSKIV